MATCGEYVATRTAAAAVIDEWGIHSPSAKQEAERERVSRRLQSSRITQQHMLYF